MLMAIPWSRPKRKSKPVKKLGRRPKKPGQTFLVDVRIYLLNRKMLIYRQVAMYFLTIINKQNVKQSI